MFDDPERSRLKKRSLTLKGHKTSITLEDPFWEILKDAAAKRGVPLAHLIIDIDTRRVCNLSSALRLFALGEVTSSSQLAFTNLGDRKSGRPE